MPSDLVQLLIITFVIHLIDTFAYSVRLNAVKSGQFALSASLFNLFYLISLIAHSIQAPLIGGLIDNAMRLNTDPLPQLRIIILASTTGTFFGIFFTPTFLRIFSKAVYNLERTGSVPSIVLNAFKSGSVVRLSNYFVFPVKNMFRNLPFNIVPRELITLNALVTGIYTIGGMSAYYAASLVTSDHRLAAAASAGIFNTAANILFMLFIDPKSSIITDQALKQHRPYDDVKALVVILMSAKLLGTLFGQVLLNPLTQAIVMFYQ
ncbi:lipid II flippase Amj family protein [Dehalobacter sp. DCM]|uniref:lipid II flippase Amj family protein n=1 Tax=Dehalobacter sp. DCM TaxID=2907827 RepID=UPI003081DF9E|nr:lipid II flippase Amj family protein [Dehalobacter sp. DCM]